MCLHFLTQTKKKREKKVCVCVHVCVHTGERHTLTQRQRVNEWTFELKMLTFQTNTEEPHIFFYWKHYAVSVWFTWLFSISMKYDCVPMWTMLCLWNVQTDFGSLKEYKLWTHKNWGGGGGGGGGEREKEETLICTKSKIPPLKQWKQCHVWASGRTREHKHWNV